MQNPWNRLIFNYLKNQWKKSKNLIIFDVIHFLVHVTSFLEIKKPLYMIRVNEKQTNKQTKKKERKKEREREKEWKREELFEF
jgi:hypothetical protein